MFFNILYLKVYKNNFLYTLLKFFKVVSFSDERGFSKPDPKLFEAVLSEVNCAP